MGDDRVIAERYALIRPIGRGAEAVVYAARDTVHDRSVAVKLVPARAGIRHDEVERFATEVRAPSAIADPGILDLTEAGIDRGDLYLVSALLHGPTLRDLLLEGDRVSLATRLDVLDGALAPLSVAHLHGHVHGDLTPSNVFVSRPRSGGERVVLLDLGLAALLDRDALVAPGLRVGSPFARAPERWSGEPPRPSADVWSFGVLLYECLTGQRPFEHEHPSALAHHVCHQDYELADVVNPEIGDSMARLVDMCLEKNPQRRPPDARAVLRLFKSLRAGLGDSGGASRHAGIPIDTVLDDRGSAPAPPPEALEHALRSAPREPTSHRALAEHYAHEGHADGTWLAAAALDFLGKASRDEIHLHHRHGRATRQPFERGLDASAWATVLHPDQDPRIDAVFLEILPALEAHFLESDEALGLDRMSRVELGRTGSALARTYARAITAIRPGVLPRLFFGRMGRAPRHVPSQPPSSVFPTGFEEPLPEGALDFAVGRHIAYLRGPHRVCTLVWEPERLEAAFAAALSAADGTRASELAVSLSDKLDDAQRIALRAAAAQLKGQLVDLGTWRRAVELSCARAGLVLGGDLDSAAWMLRWTRERPAIPLEDAIDDLLSFWTSGAHARIRHLLGLAATTRSRVA